MTPSTSELAQLPLNFWPVGQVSALSQRQGRYTRASGRHPGKMLPELARRFLLAYTRPGDWILDPMSGIGTTGVEAIHLGRNYVGVEIEPRYVRWQQENLALAREQGATGTAEVLLGDARRLAEPGTEAAPLTAGPVDAILTSPPYGSWLGASYSGQRFWETPLAGEPEVDEPADASLRDLTQIFRGGAAILKPGGILAAVVRPVRAGYRLRPFHHAVAQLCQQAGLEWIDELVALLGRVETAPGGAARVYHHAHYFRRAVVAQVRRSGYPVTLDQFEYVLVFRKPLPSPTHQLRLPAPRKSDLSAALAGPDTPREWRAEVPVIRRPA